MYKLYDCLRIFDSVLSNWCVVADWIDAKSHIETSIDLALPLLPNKAIKRAGAAKVPQGAGGDSEAWLSVCLARRAWTPSSPGARRLSFIRGASRTGERERERGSVVASNASSISAGASFPKGTRTIHGSSCAPVIIHLIDDSPAGASRDCSPRSRLHRRSYASAARFSRNRVSFRLRIAKGGNASLRMRANISLDCKRGMRTIDDRSVWDADRDARAATRGSSRFSLPLFSFQRWYFNRPKWTRLDVSNLFSVCDG